MLRDVYKEYAAKYTDSAAKWFAPMKKMTEVMLSVREKIKAGEVIADSVENAVRLMSEGIDA